MSRELMLEKRNNPDYDDLFSGREHLDEEYNQMLNHDKDLNSQLERQTHQLYSKYRTFKEGVKHRRKKRDRMLRGLLNSASVENHFLGTELPKGVKGKPEVELGPMGIEVKDHNKEIRKERLMGMKNLKDLDGLDIGKHIERRERLLRMANRKYFRPSRKHQRETPRERNLLESPVKMVKSVKSLGNQSFLLRNGSGKEQRGYFKPERGLRQVRHMKHVKTHKTKLSRKSKKGRARKLKKKAPAKGKKKPKKKGKKKKKKLVKKFKKHYKFDWRTLKWKVKKKYKYTLITNLKDLKFWRKMGIRIKKHKVKLFYRWETNRKYKKGQRQCVLTVRWSPMTYFWDLQWYYLKGTFKSNCFKYSVEKVFKATHANSRRFRIEIGKFGFDAVFYHVLYKHGWYNRQYMLNVNWPVYRTKTFNPWKKITDYIKFGLAPAKAKKWKLPRFKLFMNYQLGYPLKTEKQAQQAHEKVLKKQWVKRFGKRVPYKPKYRELREADVIPFPQRKGGSLRPTAIHPSERSLLQSPRKLRVIWRDSWMKVYVDGYRHVINDKADRIIARTSYDPVMNYADLKKLWDDRKTIVWCHGSHYRKVCRI